MADDGVLFWTYDWRAVVDAQREALRKTVYGWAGEAFAGKSLDAVADDLAEAFSLVPPTIRPREMRIERRVGAVDVSADPDRFFPAGRPATVQGVVYEARLPFSGDPQMFGVRPIAYDERPPRGRVEGGEIVFAVAGPDLTPEAAAAQIAERVRRIADYLRRQQESVGGYPQALRQLAGELAQRRKAELAEADDLWAGLEVIKRPSRSG